MQIPIRTNDQAVRVDGAAHAVHADVGVVGEAVLARDPAQRRVHLPARLGHRDELCNAGNSDWPQIRLGR